MESLRPSKAEELTDGAVGLWLLVPVPLVYDRARRVGMVVVPTCLTILQLKDVPSHCTGYSTLLPFSVNRS